MNLFHMLKGKFWKFYQSSDKKENRKENFRNLFVDLLIMEDNKLPQDLIR
jgi:hypothetical protein